MIYTLVYDDAPKSVNAGGGGSRKNQFVAHREKMQWEGIFGMTLIAAKVPKGLGFTHVTIELQFVDKRGRDAENYRHPVVKPLLDAMKKGGWLEDDTEDHVQVERLYLVEAPLADAPPLVKARTTITLQVIHGNVY